MLLLMQLTEKTWSCRSASPPKTVMTSCSLLEKLRAKTWRRKGIRVCEERGQPRSARGGGTGGRLASTAFERVTSAGGASFSILMPPMNSSETLVCSPGRKGRMSVALAAASRRLVPAYPVLPEQVPIRYARESSILDGPVWPEAVELAAVACGERRVVCREELWVRREVVPGCLQLAPLRLPCLVDLLERRLAQCGRHSTAASGRQAGEVCGKSGSSSLAGLGQSGSASLAVRVYQSRDPATRSVCVR